MKFSREQSACALPSEPVLEHLDLISAADSRVAVAIEPTNEEWIAGRQAASLAML